MLLEVQDLRVSYGAIEAVKGVSFAVNEGEIVTLVGANGSGKTTILRTISGIVRAKAGSIRYKGQDITTSRATRSWAWASPTYRKGGWCSAT